MLDKFIAILGLLFSSPVIIFSCFVSKFVHSTTGVGIFSQIRVGKNSRRFTIYKIISMYQKSEVNLSATSSNDNRLSSFGKIIRLLKIDELPQLINVIKGDMLFIGYRPEVEEVINKKYSDFSIISRYKPGITGLSSIIFRDEQNILELIPLEKRQDFSDDILFPCKCLINSYFYESRTFSTDIFILIVTIIPFLKLDHFAIFSSQLKKLLYNSNAQRRKVELSIAIYRE